MAGTLRAALRALSFVPDKALMGAVRGAHPVGHRYAMLISAPDADAMAWPSMAGTLRVARRGLSVICYQAGPLQSCNCLLYPGLLQILVKSTRNVLYKQSTLAKGLS